MDRDVAAEIADRLLAAFGAGELLPLITDSHPGFDVDDAYAVLDAIGERRRAMGWEAVGRKIGFTNTTLWELFNVDRSMFAPVWRETLVAGPRLELAHLCQPRIEPEVVFKLATSPEPDDVLASVEWVAAGFEIVHCPFAGWRFTAADCTAAFGLHGALLVGEPVAIERLDVSQLPEFALTLRRGGDEIERGTGANVLGSPALALRHLVEIARERGTPVGAGEVITTGTLTNAWEVNPGETWSSDYGTLGVPGLTITFT